MPQVEHLFDDLVMTRDPVEHLPDALHGEFVGHYIEHNKPPIPITVHVEWVDGGEGELDGWTSQWTRTHVCVVRSLEPGRFLPFWVRVQDVRRRETDAEPAWHPASARRGSWRGDPLGRSSGSGRTR